MNFSMIFKSNGNSLNIICKFLIKSKIRPKELKQNKKKKNQKQPKNYLKNTLTEENQFLYDKFKRDLEEICGNIGEDTA